MSTGDDQAAVDSRVALRINTTATVGAPTSDIIERLVTLRVQKGVQETQSRLASAQASIVQETDNTSKNGCGGGGTARESLLASEDDLVAANS